MYILQEINIVGMSKFTMALVSLREGYRWFSIDFNMSSKIVIYFET
jgi:hypothetical protein